MLTQSDISIIKSTWLFPVFFCLWYSMAASTANLPASSGFKSWPIHSYSWSCGKMRRNFENVARNNEWSSVEMGPSEACQSRWGGEQKKLPKLCDNHRDCMCVCVCVCLTSANVRVYLPWQQPEIIVLRWSITSFRFCLAISPLRSKRANVSSKKHSKSTSIVEPDMADE